MGFAIFGSPNPQPVSYTATHLTDLDRLYNDKSLMNQGVMSFIFARLLIVGTALRMVVDAVRYTSHATSDCLTTNDITPLALNSLGKAGRHSLLAIATVVFGIISPSFVMNLADLAGVLPKRSLLATVRSLATVACLVGACFLIAHVAMIAHQNRLLIEQYIVRAPAELRRGAMMIAEKVDEVTAKVTDIAQGALTCLRALGVAAQALAKTLRIFAPLVLPPYFFL